VGRSASLKNIGSAHPFRIIVSKLLKPQFVEISVTASELARGAADVERRHLNPGYYNILTPIPKGKHIMVIDDTWVSGGHAQSVAMALKRAGAAKVSILAIGRWLRMNDRRTKGVYNRFIRNRPYNADICPWTGGIVRVDRLSRPPWRVELLPTIGVSVHRRLPTHRRCEGGRAPDRRHPRPQSAVPVADKSSIRLC
jgi:hypothetical protein